MTGCQRGSLLAADELQLWYRGKAPLRAGLQRAVTPKLSAGSQPIGVAVHPLAIRHPSRRDGGMLGSSHGQQTVLLQRIPVERIGPLRNAGDGDEGEEKCGDSL